MRLDAISTLKKKLKVNAAIISALAKGKDGGDDRPSMFRVSWAGVSCGNFNQDLASALTDRPTDQPTADISYWS